MRPVRSLLLVTIWIVSVGSAFATTAPSATQLVVTGPIPVAEDTGVQHAPATDGPIVVNWHFKKSAGSTNLTVDRDGTWLFSGSYKGHMPNKDLDLALALKSSLGGVVLFRYIGNISTGGVQWSKTGKNAVLGENFTTFAGPHDWAGSYRFPLDAQAKAEHRANEKYACAQAFAAAKWNAAAAWALGETGTVQFCKQFNPAW